MCLATELAAVEAVVEAEWARADKQGARKGTNVGRWLAGL